MNENENGMTLVEVLATLVIGTMFMLLAMTIMGLNMKMNATQASTTRLQQEANLVVSQLTENHRRCNSPYNLQLSANQVVLSCNGDSQTLGGGTYNHELSVGETAVNQTTPLQVDAKQQTDVHVTLTVIDPDHQNKEMTVSTTLSRLGTLK
ncbi:PilW family protein [Bhargavaea cecembensis]|uniref:PilW family protein n=1 Tax=Bhargavaea cecembensis TaxID=394098 RepID=UPI00058D4210|nr:hypothetical protein [Bhargavaea cecembensis]